jgi:site-specific DNA recombinase
MLDRPALDRLRADAQTGRFRKLYVYSPDRLARELMLQLLVVKELKKRDIQVVFLSQQFTDSPADRLLFQMLGAISEFERAQILERTRRGKLHRARSGILIGSIPPFGYTYIRKTDKAPGRYELNPQESGTVKEIFRLFNSPHVLGIRTLARALHQLNLKNRSGNTKWAKSSLASILADSTYTGTTYFNKHMACEPLRERPGLRHRPNTSTRLRPREEWIPISVPSIITQKEFTAERASSLVMGGAYRARSGKGGAVDLVDSNQESRLRRDCCITR